MARNSGAHLVELAQVFAGTPIASEWAQPAAATRRARKAQLALPLTSGRGGGTGERSASVLDDCFQSPDLLTKSGSAYKIAQDFRGGRYHAVIARVEREEAEAELQRLAASHSAAEKSRRGDRLPTEDGGQR